ncbi:MAG: hypothetical protein ACXV8P_09030 [Methylobacter sp.]
MFEYVKKFSSNRLIRELQQVVEIDVKYQIALKKIDFLESELNLKVQELNQGTESQRLLKQGLKKCTNSLSFLQNQLQTITAIIDELQRENMLLQLSNAHWLQRALKLEFEVLSAKDEIAKIAAYSDLFEHRFWSI